MRVWGQRYEARGSRAPARARCRLGETRKGRGLGGTREGWRLNE